MATLDARLARKAAAEKRLSAALQAIQQATNVQFEEIPIPKKADAAMREVLTLEQFAGWIEAIADKLAKKGS